MATIGRTLFRLTGAVLLGASASSIDNPKLLFAPSSRVNTLPVVVANRDMPEGAVIDRMSVTVARLPVGTTPAGAFTTVEALVNRVTRVPVYKGEVLVLGRLAPDGTGPGLEVKITPGKRAMSFRINDVSGIAGLVQPNSRVDILVVKDNSAKGRAASLFMENMRVLAIGSVPQRAEDGRPINAAVATVEVTPEEGERLAVATTQGQIQVMLRGYGDPDEYGRPIDQDGRPVLRDLLLRSGQAQRVRVLPTPVKPTRPDSFALKVFRGTTTAEELKFAKDSAARAKGLRKHP
jgi:pilus assembly protein CpaB